MSFKLKISLGLLLAFACCQYSFSTGERMFIMKRETTYECNLKGINHIKGCMEDESYIIDTTTCLYISPATTGNFSFFDAKEKCASQGMNIVEIRSIKEALSLRTLIDMKRPNTEDVLIWLGLRVDVTNRTLTYMSDGSQVQKGIYVSLDLDSKRGNHNSCVVLHHQTNMWSLQSCAEANGIIVCERSSTATPGRPMIEIDTDPTKWTGRITEGEDFTVKCEDVINGGGSLQLVIFSEPNRRYTSRKNRDMIEKRSKLSILREDEGCILYEKVEFVIKAEKVLNDMYLGCVSKTVPGQMACSESDPFCTFLRDPLCIVQEDQNNSEDDSNDHQRRAKSHSNVKKKKDLTSTVVLIAIACLSTVLTLFGLGYIYSRPEVPHHRRRRRRRPAIDDPEQA